ncbi:mechanosensitive ion channel [Bacillus sp. RG28]|uniref:Mechanosensitive ion channel n=2 Tax=Gottfriedia endophytica TaxID=2820819 RepID=A0A940NNQ9_9BACI|nr:mechanosensitive ion channel [Gottfriedia endophytica]
MINGKDIQTFIDKYIISENEWSILLSATIRIALIIIGAILAIKYGKKVIRKVLKVQVRGPLQVSERRSLTLVKLLESVLVYVVFFIAVISILPIFHVEIKGLLVGAGVGGVALGFGAQSLVKDIISGFFILFEDQFSVGDFVRIQNFEGTVKEIGLRTTKVRASTGELHIIQNGLITEVTNFSLNNAIAIIDFNITYEGDIEHAQQVIEAHLETMPKQYEEMVDTPKFLGVQNLGPAGVTLRITSEVKPMTQFKISRAIRKEIKEVLEANNIEISFPKMVLYNQQ